jgi:hypothetical protein
MHLDAATGAQIWNPRGRCASGKNHRGARYLKDASTSQSLPVRRRSDRARNIIRGSVVALMQYRCRLEDHTIAEEPKPVGKNTNGVRQPRPRGGMELAHHSPARQRLRRHGDAYTLPPFPPTRSPAMI